MKSKAESARLSKGKKFLFLLVMYAVIGGLFVAAAEVVLRAKGIRPWETKAPDITVEPGGRLYRKNPTLGYENIPGSFEITLGKEYRYRVTHGPDTLRITHPLRADDAGDGGNGGNGENGGPKKEEIWIFGCSYTHGFSLNDDETYAWVLQERFPEFEFRNFGVGGYGTIHSLIQFREALESGRRPKIAVIAYGEMHDERNTFARNRRKRVAPWNFLGPIVQPYARFDGAGGLKYAMAKVDYREFPLMRVLSLAHLVEMKYNEREYRFSRSHEVSEALLKEMAAVAAAHDVKFVVVGILPDTITGRTLERMREAEIPAVDISVNPHLPENTNLPYDGHPSAVANREFARKLGDFLAPMMK